VDKTEMFVEQCGRRLREASYDAVHGGLYWNPLYLLPMAEIVRTADVLGGQPRIEGTRVGVVYVYELVVGGDHPPADVADQLDLSLGEVYSALAYYHEHPDEMREVRRDQGDAEATLAEASLSPPEPAK